MSTDRVPGLTKLYVWSVVLEPMLFFVLFANSVTGVTGNVSRLLQAVVVFVLVARLFVRVLTPQIRLPRSSWRWSLDHTYLEYVALAVVAGVIGVLSGAFDTPMPDPSGIVTYASTLNSALVRPLFEYVIAVYYFWYFVVLPRTMLRTPRQLDYLFKVFGGMFVLSFVVGVIGLSSAALLHVEIVPRHLYDLRMVGARFHGLAGEPRHAFVFLFLGLAMLHLRAWYQGRRMWRAWTPLIIVAAMLTQSAAGFFGIAAFVAMFVAQTLRRMSVRRILRLVTVVLVVGVLTVLAVRNLPRARMYAANLQGVWQALEQRDALPGALASQGDSVYPVYDLVLKVRDGDLLPVVIGSGLGSAAAVNSRLATEAAQAGNPNSQFVRLLYESGLVGTALFILAFARPVARLTRDLSPEVRHRFMTLMLLVLGCGLGFRSAAPFIFLGVLIAVMWVRRDSGH
jgi:O-antigen ligase